MAGSLVGRDLSRERRIWGSRLSSVMGGDSYANATVSYKMTLLGIKL